MVHTLYRISVELTSWSTRLQLQLGGFTPTLPFSPEDAHCWVWDRSWNPIVIVEKLRECFHVKWLTLWSLFVSILLHSMIWRRCRPRRLAMSIQRAWEYLDIQLFVRCSSCDWNASALKGLLGNVQILRSILRYIDVAEHRTTKAHSVYRFSIIHNKHDHKRQRQVAEITFSTTWGPNIDFQACGGRKLVHAMDNSQLRFNIWYTNSLNSTQWEGGLAQFGTH